MAAWHFLVPQAIMLTIGTALAGTQIGLAMTKHHPRVPPTAPGMNAKQVVPALGAAVEAAEETLGETGGGPGKAVNGTFGFTHGHGKAGKDVKNVSAVGPSAMELYIGGLPEKATHSPACSDNPGCEALRGACCPTWDGINLGCCFSWRSEGSPNFPEYVKDGSEWESAKPSWHATMRDPFSGVLQAETMQPIYLLPVTNGLKQLVVFFVFGFDLKFKPLTGTWQRKVLKWFVSSVSRLCIIGLAINAFRHDWQKFMRKDQLQSSHYNEMMILMAVWCISPNFTMGLGIWNQLRLQSPGAVFKKEIKESRYCRIWAPGRYADVRFPLCPGGARWLTVLKQVYALVLLPYVMPAMLLEWLMSSLLCYWIVFKSKLLCLIKCLQVHVITVICVLIWLITLGHTGGMKIEKYWTTLWPFVYMYLVYLFASFIMPLVIALLYGFLIRANFFQVWKGVGCMQKSIRTNPGQLHSAVGKCMEMCESTGSGDEDDCCGYYCFGIGPLLGKRCRFAWFEEKYAKIMPHRELQLEENDRELLMRLDSYRLSKDFKFKEDSASGGAIEKLRQKLMKMRQRMEGRYLESDDSEEFSDNEKEPNFFQWGFNVLVGDGTCEDGDRNVDKDPCLLQDLANKAENNLDDSEVQIVMLTVKSLAEVAVIQALTIFLVRTLTGENFSDFVNAMNITIQERHIRDWIHHLAATGEHTIGKALHSVYSV